jgi:hypothetical protein
MINTAQPSRLTRDDWLYTAVLRTCWKHLFVSARHVIARVVMTTWRHPPQHVHFGTGSSSRIKMATAAAAGGMAATELRQRWVPENDPEWDDSLPYGGKVFLARKKKRDPLHVRVLEVWTRNIHGEIHWLRIVAQSHSMIHSHYIAWHWSAFNYNFNTTYVDVYNTQHYSKNRYS